MMFLIGKKIQMLPIQVAKYETPVQNVVVGRSKRESLIIDWFPKAKLVIWNYNAETGLSKSKQLALNVKNSPIGRETS